MNKFISRLSGKEYILAKKLDRSEFQKELDKAGLTRETYADKFFKNLSDKKHLRPLKDGEFYLYKKINYVKETYEKVIIDKKWKCELCENFYATNTSSFWSHVSRVHHLSINEYLEKVNYHQTTEKIYCSFCGKEAEFSITLDPENKTYTKIYKFPRCNTYECNNNLCLEFFNKPYEECKKQFEHIGGKTEYLCKLYKTDPEGLKKIGKSKEAKHKSKWKSNLHGFIEKYGIEEGKRRYEQRCKNVGHGTSLAGYIERLGKEEGTRRYLAKLEKCADFHKRNKNITSKGELELFNLLKEESNSYELEYATPFGIIDIYNKEKNVIIEYYGDYWHCNPLFYENDYYHKAIKMTAEEKHKFDESKNNNYLKNLNNPFIIIIWESSFKAINKDILKEQINEFVENEKNKGKILWI